VALTPDGRLLVAATHATARGVRAGRRGKELWNRTDIPFTWGTDPRWTRDEPTTSHCPHARRPCRHPREGSAIGLLRTGHRKQLGNAPTHRPMRACGATRSTLLQRRRVAT
jgi:hypothetical protein